MKQTDTNENRHRDAGLRHGCQHDVVPVTALIRYRKRLSADGKPRSFAERIGARAHETRKTHRGVHRIREIIRYDRESIHAIRWIESQRLIVRAGNGRVDDRSTCLVEH
jgi:hypothetical protein